jgi:hypothetical protein
MHQFLYEFLSNKLCTDMTFEIKGYLLGNVVEKIKIIKEYDEDEILRRKNRWRKYSL